MNLPAKVTATLADDGPDGRVYRLADTRGYTHRLDTIRVRRGSPTTYVVETSPRDGWTFLLSGTVPGRMGPIGPVDPSDLTINYDEAVRRAVAVLYGMEDHG